MEGTSEALECQDLSVCHGCKQPYICGIFRTICHSMIPSRPAL